MTFEERLLLAQAFKGNIEGGTVGGPEFDNLVDKVNGIDTTVENIVSGELETVLDNQVIATQIGDKLGALETLYAPKLSALDSYKMDLPISVRDFGAIGDGITDDTQAFEDAIAESLSSGNKNIHVPTGKFLLTRPLILTEYTKVKGMGEQNTRIIKYVDTTIHVEGTDSNPSEDVNGLFILRGHKICIEDLSLEGNLEGKKDSFGKGTFLSNVFAITFGPSTAEFKLNRVDMSGFKRCFYDKWGCWYGEIQNVFIHNSEDAFVFKESSIKTLLSIRNCCTSNCGQSYYFYRVQYSNIVNCGADWSNWIENSIDWHGFGNQATDKGIYHFEQSFAVTCSGLATENSWGNGLVSINGSSVSIDGLIAYNLRSDYLPSKAQGMGFITTGSERVNLSVSNFYGGNITPRAFRNQYPLEPIALITNNYDEDSYGVNANARILLGHAIPSLLEGNIIMFGGRRGSKECKNLASIVD